VCDTGSFEKKESPTLVDTTRAKLKTTLPTILILLCIRYSGNISIEQLPSNGSGIFTKPLPTNDKE
jgi:hypothetical protein